MPTATITATSTAPSLKQASSSSSALPLAPAPQATAPLSILNPLYTRAAKAFLHRDLALTRSLLISAFSVLQPPPSAGPDPLTNHRRKWDILRITLETTSYATSGSHNPEAGESSQTFLNRLYSRSSRLFTPVGANPDGFALPPQIVQTLVLSSLKLDCPDVGRSIAEDWLSLRLQYDTETEGYEKVLEIYCLHILPKLEQWDYAQEFLEYEVELPTNSRERLKASLAGSYAQHTSTQQAAAVLPPAAIPWTSSPPRSHSPDSTASSVSTHTVVPRTRPRALASTAMSRTQSTASISSASTYRPTRRKTPPQSAQRPTSIPRPPLSPRLSVELNTSPPSFYSLIKAYVSPHLTMSTSKVVTLFVLFFVIPVVSLLLRARRRRRLALVAGGAPGPTPANMLTMTDAVRKRLQSANGGPGIASTMWQAFYDFMQMGGRGLV